MRFSFPNKIFEKSKLIFSLMKIDAVLIISKVLVTFLFDVFPLIVILKNSNQVLHQFFDKD